MSLQAISLTTIIPENLQGARLDQALAILFSDYSRARLQLWVREGKVTVDGKQLRSKDKVLAGQALHLAATLQQEIFWQGEPIQLDVIYEDASLLIINKPAGLVVHPAAGNLTGTLVNALLHHAPELKNIPRAGIVHRLDKDTSGLLVVARTLPAHTDLVAQIQARTVKREYLAIVNGTFTAGGTIDAPVGRHSRQRTKMAVLESGKTAVTHYRIAERFRAHTALQVFLETGRTHQIRVHMAHIGHALIGDPTYGGRLKMPAGCSEVLRDMLRNFGRQALHAIRLSLTHPKTGQEMQWEAPFPEDIQILMRCLHDDMNLALSR
jgi:23S rRNA pseudouridine1911/1915/1917 synthase